MLKLLFLLIPANGWKNPTFWPVKYSPKALSEELRNISTRGGILKIEIELYKLPFK